MKIKCGFSKKAGGFVLKTLNNKILFGVIEFCLNRRFDSASEITFYVINDPDFWHFDITNNCLYYKKNKISNVASIDLADHEIYQSLKIKVLCI